MPSDYTKRNFVALHIKKETRSRLVMAKARYQANTDEFISQDEFINILLDRMADKETAPQAVAEYA
jgi:hypothetical protein